MNGAGLDWYQCSYSLTVGSGPWRQPHRSAPGPGRAAADAPSPRPPSWRA